MLRIVTKFKYWQVLSVFDGDSQDWEAVVAVVLEKTQSKNRKKKKSRNVHKQESGSETRKGHSFFQTQMIITISGDAGSGKSTTAELVAKKLKLKHYSVGDLQRHLAATRGLTLEAYNKLCARNPKIDKEVDAFQTRLGKTQDNFVIDGRLSWFFIPNSFKIFLKCDEDVAAARVWKDHEAGKRTSEAGVKSVADIAREIRERNAGDTKRYQKTYRVNYRDQKHYDVVLDTSALTPVQTLNAVLAFVKTAKSKKQAA